MTDNVIINGDTASVLLYGEIFNNSPSDDGEVVLSKTIVSQIMTLSQSCRALNVHINSEGGEVYAGVAIFNALRSCSKEVTIYTDGIAASIAGIIAMCGRKHYMSRYARLMIHSVSAGVFGDKTDFLAIVEEIQALEGNLAIIIGERMGITPEEVKARYFDGKDHWFTAQEAVAAGLADGIYDIDVSVAASDSPKDVYKKTFTNRAALCSQNQNTMFDVRKFTEKPHFTNVTSEEEILRVIDELNTQIETLESENSSLREQISTLQNEDIERILEAAVAAGKIEEGEKSNYRDLLNANRASAESVINSLKPRRKVINDIAQGGGAGAPTESAWEAKMRQIRNNYKR